jgi:hypothetical protein
MDNNMASACKAAVRCEKRPFVAMRVLDKNDGFTKTGSGQMQEKLNKLGVLCAALRNAAPQQSRSSSKPRKKQQQRKQRRAIPAAAAAKAAAQQSRSM